MGGFVGGLITVVVIIVGLIQALAPVFKSISEAIEKSRQPPGQTPRQPGGMNANNPSSFLPEMTQQGAPRPANQRSDVSLTDVPKVYVHQRCGGATKMPEDVIRNYLRDPYFYKADTTFCTGCQAQVPLRECRWTETGEDLQTYTDRLRAGNGKVRGAGQSRVQSEIASFLGGKQQAASGSQQKPKAQTAPTAQRENRPRQYPKQKPQRSSAAGQAAPAAQTRQKPRPIGSGVAAHVESFIGGHVDEHIGHQLADAVKTDISDQVRSHLGEDKNRPSAPTAATTHGSAAAGDLLLALRSPQGVRQAILISEVLSRPKALRRS